MRIFFDGSGWNGRSSGYAVVFSDSHKAPIVVRLREEKTNNEMEYAGLLEALTHAEAGDELFTDSQLLVGQVLGGWKVNAAHLKPLVEKAKALVLAKRVTLVWVPREQNAAGKFFE
ncbi:ribonuclease HI family protein [Candidatus Micrarchaeota archaeon]|nr:ribonuclease HI family protein [Candidatus Micrarchaeota archaeon]